MKKINIKRKYLLLLIGLAVCLLLGGILSYGKFFRSNTEDIPTKAIEMFFTSDVLTPTSENNQPEHIVVDWQNGVTNNLSFELHNYPDSQRFTNRPILYELSADQPGVSFRSSNGHDFELPASTANTNQQSQKIDVQLETDFWQTNEKEKTVTISARATKPYVETLSAKFLIKRQATGYQVKVEDEADSPYITVTITADTAQSLSLTWDDSLVVPDQTNACFVDKIENNALTLKEIPAGGAVTFYLFKFDESNNYSDVADIFKIN
ncbi:hypothetical protein [Enterococcus alishanensis]|uniref:Uncharacterized protein n=1 Tax=Enterococcus alishanensis TaxID=1303817 RepID=A0ABS6TCM8_9ENTE|nr:hypothetical protein [Enterococcus alishanensis]MBV7390594.1 hypothetical protein [Enterococcus alishanensis]